MRLRGAAAGRVRRERDDHVDGAAGGRARAHRLGAAGPDNYQQWAAAIFQQYVGAGLTDKPVYITEWGFHRQSFPYQGKSRAQYDELWLEYVNGYQGLRFGAAILYDFKQETQIGLAQDYDMFDGNTLRQDEATQLSSWNQ